MPSWFPTVLLLLAVCSAPAGAQWKYDVTLTGYPHAAWKSLTAYVDKPALGDVTGDGVPEIIGVSVFGDVYCVDGLTGQMLWTYEDDHSFDLAIYICPAIVDLDCDGILDIVSVTSAGSVIALDGRAGRKLWSFKADGPIVFSPTAFDTDRNGTPEIAVSDTTGALYLLDNSGRQLWKEKSSTPFFGAPAMGLSGDRSLLLMSDRAGVLRAYDARGGRELWRYQPTDVPLSTSPLLFEDRSDGAVPLKAIVGTDGGEVRLVNAASGQPIWIRRMAKAAIGDFSLADLRGSGALQAVFATAESNIISVAVGDGKIAWSRRIRAPVKNFHGPAGGRKITREVVAGQPVLADVDGDALPDVIVEIRGLNNYLYALSGLNGRVVWSYGNRNLYLNPALTRSVVVSTYQETTPLSATSDTVPVFSHPTPVVADFDLDGKADLIINDRDEVGLISMPLGVRFDPGGWPKYVANACNNIAHFSVPCLARVKPPTLDVSIEPNAIVVGETARLCWKSTGANDVDFGPGMGIVPPSNCVGVTPVRDTRWTAVARNCGGEASARVALRVNERPVPPKPAPPPPPTEPVVLEDVLFEYDWYRLTADAVRTLDRNIGKLVLRPDAHVVLEATCDERGSLVYNQLLSVARGEAVRGYLLAHGIDENRIELRPLGETTRWDPRLNDEGWAANRRVHFVVSPR